uniref:Uncharacterized protein n=1 Tax=Ixodes ricinus TaxID=34613 RepID=A0A0K8R7A3_IXORI
MGSHCPVAVFSPLHENVKIRPHLGRDSGWVITPFNAGRQLFDKAFRYLRTLGVRAAVHRSFSSCCFHNKFLSSALGRRQTLYLVFLRCKVLCFC